MPQQDGSIRGAEQFFVHGFVDGLAPGARRALPVPPRGRHDHPRRGVHHRSRAANALAPFTFTAFADQGVNARSPPARPASATTTTSRRPAAPAAPSTHWSRWSRRSGPRSTCSRATSATPTPSGYGHPVKNNGAGTADNGFDNFDPTVWSQYFGVIEKSAATTPWLFATGNHDMEALYDDNRARRRDARVRGPRRPARPAAHRPGGLPVGVLRGLRQRRRAQPRRQRPVRRDPHQRQATASGAQLTWLTRRLGELRADPDVDFVVAFFHHCAYATSAAHASDAGVRAALAPLFDRVRRRPRRAGPQPPVRAHRPDPRRRRHPRGPRRRERRRRARRHHLHLLRLGRPAPLRLAARRDRQLPRHGADARAAVPKLPVGGGRGQEAETVDWVRTRYLDDAYPQHRRGPGAPGSTTTMTIRTIDDLGGEVDRVPR